MADWVEVVDCSFCGAQKVLKSGHFDVVGNCRWRAAALVEQERASVDPAQQRVEGGGKGPRKSSVRIEAIEAYDPKLRPDGES